MKRRVDHDLKMKVYKRVEQYISLWNDDVSHEDKIHYACLEENPEDDYIISVFVDFENCDPIALAGLLKYLKKARFGIKQITLL